MKTLLALVLLLPLCIVHASDAGIRMAPPMEMSSFKGGTVAPGNQRGKVVLLTFWYPSCEPCRAQFPYLEEVMRKFEGQDVVYMGANTSREEDAEVLPFLTNTQYSFTALKAGKAAATLDGYNFGQAPASFLIDRAGRIAYSGFIVNDAASGRELQQRIESLLAVPYPATPADVAWQAFEELPLYAPAGYSEEQALAWYREHVYAHTAPAALAFYRRFPDDPRRWDAAYDYVRIILNTSSAAKPEEIALMRTLVAEILDGDAERRVKLRAAFEHMEHDLSPESNPAVLHADIGEIERWVEKFRTRFAVPATTFSENYISFVEQWYVDILLMRDLPAAERRLRVDQADHNIEIAQMAKGRMEVLEAKRRPMQLKFIAVDGREVDLGKLRGKVVLVDFWAMWCGSCVEELPNVRRVYDAYNAKGFEVVGISLDGKDSRDKLLKFVDERKMPWPQYFDGKDWDNDVARQFGVRAIPAMFVLDRKGRLVTMDASGPKLEETVKRLLADGGGS